MARIFLVRLPYMTMEEVALRIEDLLCYGAEKLGLSVEDKAYARNQLLELFQVEPAFKDGNLPEDMSELIEELTDYALDNGICEDGEEVRFETRLMGLITPSPSSVVYRYNEVYRQEGIRSATKYLYNLSVDNFYIRLKDIRKNLCWYAKGKKGRIAITINLSKPEKDPKQVLAEKQFTGRKYPMCMLCMENIGFCGTATLPARQTLRHIPVTLNGEPWHMQFSPYLYYDEHIIVFNEKHLPMQITDKTPVRLLSFVRRYPFYFLGSNADLPIVGGSILSHDHYQGGRKVLPMFSRGYRKIYYTNEEVNVGVKDWYNSVVTLRGKDPDEVAKKAATVIDVWKTYSDPENDVIAESNGVRHNTVTPVAYYKDGYYVFDLILRNNRTDEAHPFGIFHPTEDMHNIKKEAIGLIEAMGLFILPGRLKGELGALMTELTKEKPDLEMISKDEKLSKHFNMFVQIMADHGTGLTPEKAQEVVLEAVNKVCFRILECTAVFKNDKKGKDGMERFIRAVVIEDNKRNGRE